MTSHDSDEELYVLLTVAVRAANKMSQRAGSSLLPLNLLAAEYTDLIAVTGRLQEELRKLEQRDPSMMAYAVSVDADSTYEALRRQAVEPEI